LPRIYTQFPSRGPGIALLLLRGAIGATLILHAGFLSQFQDLRIAVVAMGVLAFFSGLALLAGFLTPIVSIVALLIIAGTGFTRFPAFNGGATPGNLPSLEVVVMAAAIVLLGPGAFSVDAHLFGRRKIIIPPASPSQRA
jgi:uncharacterized membrane protein YphA (DoxX/SURF4 family)